MITVTNIYTHNGILNLIKIVLLDFIQDQINISTIILGNFNILLSKMN